MQTLFRALDAQPAQHEPVRRLQYAQPRLQGPGPLRRHGRRGAGGQRLGDGRRRRGVQSGQHRKQHSQNMNMNIVCFGFQCQPCVCVPAGVLEPQPGSHPFPAPRERAGGEGRQGGHL